MLALVAVAILPAMTIRVDDSAAGLLNTFVPSRTLGAALDGHQEGDTARIYRPETVRQMLSAGLGPISYRLRTELGIEAWHWNPKGHWSGHDEGYWSSAVRSPRIEAAFGYRLPRRGDTVDQANNDGYSRIDDGDRTTFWKSNPYLTHPFTGDPDETHPQDIYLNLGQARAINRIDIDWAAPYATKFEVDHWTGDSEPGPSDGAWEPFPKGIVERGHGGIESIRLSDVPIAAQWVRVRMVHSSSTSLSPSKDVRDRCGYAVNEISLGVVEPGGFTDWVTHRKDRKQTVVAVSSTDSWHRATDVDRSTEQPGFDAVARSGLTRGEPMLVTVPTLFGCPSDAVDIVKYLKSRHIPVRGIELGEEPDGQAISPEDYASLYVQVAEAIRRVDPKVPLGGPSFETIQFDAFPFPHPEEGSWTKRFVEALRRKGKLSLLNFCSFEFYAWDAVVDAPSQLASLRGLLRESMLALWDSGLPRSVPLVVSEYGWSPFAAMPEVDLDGALYDAELVGTFLSLGGRAAFLYGYEPSNLVMDTPGNGWGDNMLFLGNEKLEPVAKVARYWSAWMLTHCWATQSDKPLKLYRAESEGLVRAYPLRLPDGSWSVLLLNLDPKRAVSVQIQVGPVSAGRQEVWQFGRDQYAWKPNGASGRPSKSLPPKHLKVNGPLALPAYSVSVVRFR